MTIGLTPCPERKTFPAYAFPMNNQAHLKITSRALVVTLLLLNSLAFLSSASAVAAPSVRLISPKLNSINSLEITSQDLGIGLTSDFNAGSKSYILIGPEVGKDLKFEYLVTKDGTNPWPNKEVYLLMGGSDSNSNASWSWNGNRYGPAGSNFYSKWMEKIPATTNSEGIATFTIQNIDTGLLWYHSNTLSLYQENPRSFLSTRFEIEIPGYSNFYVPYILQDVIRVVIAKSPNASGAPSSSPTPTATTVPQLTYNFSTSIVKRPPATIKWGKSFIVSIKTQGRGGALCEMVFQNPGWPSRQGITTFRLTAGRTTNVTVRPWARLFLSYPLKYVCIPNGWPMINSDGSISIYDKRVGGTLGNVTIVP